MIERPRHEYEAMRSVEDRLWWYKILNGLVLGAIRKRFPDREPGSLRILDAGCGTGGLMRHLIAAGYTQVEGFDLSEDALDLATSSGLTVKRLDLGGAGDAYEGRTFDIVISNEVLYYLPKPSWLPTLTGLAGLVAEDGLLVMNLAAGKKYSGTHDVAVGIKERIEPSAFKHVIADAGLSIRKEKRWPFLLAPAIYLTRTLQRRRLAGLQPDEIKSDLQGEINPITNRLFYAAAWLSTVLPFGAGSSVFYALIPTAGRRRANATSDAATAQMR